MSVSALPPASSPPNSSGPTAAGNVAVIANPPPDVARAAVGTIISGIVVGHDAQGHTTLQTAKGTLTLLTHANLPVGSNVSTEVRATGDRLQVIVLSVEPQPSAKLGQAAAQLQEQTSPQGQTRSSAGLVPGRPGAPTVSTAAQPQMGEGARATALGRSPAIVTGQGPVVQAPIVHPDLARQILAAASLTPQTFGTTPRTAPGPGQAPSSQTPGGLTPGGEVSVRILGFEAPSAPPGPPPGLRGGLPSAPVPGPGSGLPSAPVPGPALLAAHAGGAHPAAVVGHVIGATPAGQPVVQTPVGTIVLAIKSDLPVGSRMLLELASPNAGATSGPTALPADPGALAVTLARGWPALEEAVAALRQQNPAAAARAAESLPRPDSSLAANLLTMMQSLAGAKSSEWLPAALRAGLEKLGRGELKDRVEREAGQMARLTAESTSSDWRVFFLPLLDESSLRQINMFLRRHGGDGDSPEESETRFVVEVEFSRFGALQLDGLVGQRRFDLVLRTRAPLPAEMRGEIARIHADARSAAGLTGDMTFQVVRSFPVAPLDEIAHKRSGLLA